MDSYFARLSSTAFRPTEHVSGAWNPSEIHFSVLAGLIVHAIDEHRAERAADGKQLGRISYDILGFLPLEDCDIRVETTRPGRTIELIEATVSIGDRAVVRARAWYLIASDTAAIAGGTEPVLPHPDSVAGWPISDRWSGGFVASVEFRPVGEMVPGRTTAWVRARPVLVADESSSELAGFLTLIDLANGIAVRQPPTEWAFPNLDLTIHLYRQPSGPWVGLDTSVAFGPTGAGLTSSVLHDLDGPVGTAQQILTLRALT